MTFKKLAYVFAIIFTAALNLEAQDYSDPAGEGEVIVERMRVNTDNYKIRRNRFGVHFAANFENFNPKNYLSLIQNKNYEELLGNKSIPLYGIELGARFNYQLGSITGLIGYAQGYLSDDKLGIDKMSATITKADLIFAFDNIMNEPYVVPFIQVGIHSIDWTEQGTVLSITKKENFTTEFSNFHYKAGLSFQLNWIENSIDPSSQDDALRSSGLENTFIDVFYTSYTQSLEVAQVAGASGDADISSSEIGAGLRLEF